MTKKKPELRYCDSTPEEPPLTVEEKRPSFLCEQPDADAIAEAGLAVIRMLGAANGFALDSTDTLTYCARPLRGAGEFKVQLHGVTMWVDDSSTEEVVTYLYNRIASELTVECNDDFAIITNFENGDLGIRMPRAPAVTKPPLIDRSEAAVAFGGSGRKKNTRPKGK